MRAATTLGRTEQGTVLETDVRLGDLLGVDVDIGGLATVWAPELGLRVLVEVELLHHRVREGA